MSYFNQDEEEAPLTPKFTVLDAPSASAISSASRVSRGFDSDSDEDILESDGEDGGSARSDNEQPARDAQVAGQPSNRDSDAEMSDDDESDFLGSTREGCDAKKLDKNQASKALIERIFKQHLEHLRSVHLDTLARVDALAKTRMRLSEQLSALHWALLLRRRINSHSAATVSEPHNLRSASAV
ncbi:hypothetical protein CC2G_002200 [Coprinopsis cinerea AmutBmut pab1-1]|nr:hypothetical protein CC2G_002200 [Coprinopsis cinerea AmutBmut pab1-1]